MRTKPKGKPQQQETKIYWGKEEKLKQKDQKQQARKALVWARSIAQHPQFYSVCKEDHDNYQYYHILIQSFKKVELSLSARRKAFLQLTAIVYDSQKLSFIGHTLFTDIIQCEQYNPRSAIECSKSIYLYTSQQQLTVRFCLWKLDCQKNSKGAQFVNKRSFLGQFDVKIGPNGESGSITKPLQPSENQTLFISSEKEEILNQNGKNQASSSPQVGYKVLNTHTLSFMRYFIPSNYLCDSNTAILGLKSKKIQENGQVLIGQRSKLRLQVRCLSLPRVIVKRFLQVAEQKVSQSYDINGLPKSSLKDMILHVQYHNGWKSVCNESFVLVQSTNQSLLVSKQMTQSKMKAGQSKAKVGQSKMKAGQSSMKSILKKTNKINDSQSGNRIFIFGKMKQLSAVFTEQGGVLLYSLQAKVQVTFETHKNNEKTTTKKEIVNLPVAFSIKAIEQMEQEQTSNFELKLGNLFNLSHLTKYLEELTEEKGAILLQNQPKIMCEVLFYLLKGKGGMQAMTNNAQKQAQQVQQLKAQKQKLARLKRKLRQEKRKRLIELNQEIPFLDPTRLKAELYEEKIQQMQSQKQEKEDELFFLKTKIAQLERLQLKNKFQNQEKTDSEQDFGIDVTKQLPQNFQDYRAEEESTDLGQQQTIIQDIAKFSKKAIKLTKFSADSPLLQQWVSTKTYLNMRIVKLQALIEDVQLFSFGIQNANGILKFTNSITVLYEENSYEAINVLLSTNSSDSLHSLLQSLSNGFLPIYVQCNNIPQQRGVGLAEIGPLFQQLQQKGIHSAQLRCKIEFRQENTPLCELEAVFSFTQSQQTEQVPKNRYISTGKNDLNTQKLSFKSRIDRFKEFNNIENSNKSKKVIVQKAISALKIEKHELGCSNNRPNSLKLKLTNFNDTSKRFQVVICDEDAHYLQQAELTIQLPSQIHSFKKIQEEKTQAKDSLELPAKSEVDFIAIYVTKRQFLRDVNKSRIQRDKNIYKRFNHIHKIVLTVLQVKTRIVQKVFQLTILPQMSSYALVIQKYLSGDSKAIVLPISTQNFSIESDLQVEVLPTRFIFSLPKTQQTENYSISGLRIFKLLSNRKVLCSELQLWIWKCFRMQVSTRLWQQEDILLKVPLQEILKAQLRLGHQITNLQITSRHIDLKIRSNSKYQHHSSIYFSKKNNEIYIRGRLRISAVGKQIYPVLIGDQFGNNFYKMAVTADIAYPSLAQSQIITLKIPHQNLDQLEQFAFTNKTEYDTTFRAKSLRANLVQIVQKEKQLKKGEIWKLKLRFDWKRIEEELKNEGQSQCSCLLGIMNGFAIEYVLFKCREK